MTDQDTPDLSAWLRTQAGVAIAGTFDAESAHHLHTAADRLDAQQAEIGRLRAERDEAVSCLRELHAMVWGECRSLLDEDSGGDGNLGVRIESLLAEDES